MFTEEQFEQTIRLVAELNSISQDLAGELVAYVGDTPERDDQDNIVAYSDDGTRYVLIWPTDE